MSKPLKIILVRLHSISDEIIPPLHFGYLASNINPVHEVKILDQLRDQFTLPQMINGLSKLQPDILGFSAYSKDITPLKKILQQLRPVLPQTLFLLGGVQMSVMPRETLSYMQYAIDYGFAGEAEIGFSQFVDSVSAGDLKTVRVQIPNLVWRSEGDIVENERTVVQDLDQIAFPRWELMPPGAYPKAPHGAFLQQYPFAPVITSRGCPYPCTFCSASALSGKKIRYRSIQNVLDEIKVLNTQYGVKEIHIEDDNFSMKPERVIHFAEELLAANLNISWCFPNGLRLDKLDLPTLKLMRRAGCYSLNVGVESGNDDWLKKIKKRTTTEKLRENIKRVKAAGIDIGGFFIIGFPGERLHEMENTLNFAKTLDLDRIGVSYFQPYPGTEEYRKLVSSGKYRFEFEQSHHSLHTRTYIPEGISDRELKFVRLKGFLKFYFRPKIIVKLLREIQNAEHLFFILKRGFRWLTS